MSEPAEWLTATLTHHHVIVKDAMGCNFPRLIDSQVLDRGMGLSWRNIAVDELVDWAAFYDVPANQYKSRLCLDAALLKEDAIKNGINLEDKL